MLGPHLRLEIFMQGLCFGVIEFYDLLVYQYFWGDGVLFNNQN